MAKRKSNKKDATDRSFNKALSMIKNIMNQLSVTTYGTDMEDEAENLGERFSKIMSNNVDRITDNGTNGFDSFLGKLYVDDMKDTRQALESIAVNQLRITEGGYLNPQDFITESYRNRLLKQADAHNISNQLIELREAKSVMRDVILSADVNTGRINRQLIFDSSGIPNTSRDYTTLIESMEVKNDLLRKIKDFIVDNTLGYGSYYVYTIPYFEVFNNFVRKYKSSTSYKMDGKNRFFESADADVENITISPIYESADILKNRNEKKNVIEDSENFFESVVDSVINEIGDEKRSNDKNFRESVRNDVKTLLGDRITVNDDTIPLPILEEGLAILEEFGEEYITESGCFCEAGVNSSKKSKSSSKKDGVVIPTDEDTFIRKYGNSSGYGEEDTGLFSRDTKAETFTEADVKDCYIKMIPPTRMLEVKIMGEVLFYIYIKTDEAESLSTILTYTSQLRAKDPSNKIDTLVDDIANRVVSKFNKKFIRENIEFRKLIVSALEYYDLSNVKIHFQLIPKEYITAFKINKDIDGNGHSMLEPSLFYAKIYLMLFVFDVFTILTKSHDQQINYIRTSGIDKNTFNKAQKIIRQKQARKITLNDIFSYTSIINKVGAGSEIYMPLTKSGDKPLESEILQGQDVNLNSDFMEKLRTNYILGTSVPSAIMNYLNETDFAKSIETANTKMNGAAINYQIDLNEPLTEMYQKLLRYSTSMPEEIIQTVRFVLPEPKGSSNIATQEILNNYQTLQDFIVRLKMGDNPDDDDLKKIFLDDLARVHLPMINFDIIDRVFESATLKRQKEAMLHPDDEADLGL